MEVCGSVGRGVTFDTRGLQFDSSHKQNFVFQLTVTKKVKEAWNWNAQLKTHYSSPKGKLQCKQSQVILLTSCIGDLLIPSKMSLRDKQNLLSKLKVALLVMRVLQLGVVIQFLRYIVISLQNNHRSQLKKFYFLNWKKSSAFVALPFLFYASRLNIDGQVFPQ